MINLLRDAGREDFAAVVERDFVILVFFDGGAERGENLRGAGLVGGIGRAQSGHEHVGHVHVHVGHIGVGGARGGRTGGDFALRGGRGRLRRAGHVAHGRRGLCRGRRLRLGLRRGWRLWEAGCAQKSRVQECGGKNCEACGEKSGRDS
ncbi:MAG: hypothetical protein WBE87_09420 [Candidatus Acidiferrales bacterium]